MIAKSSAGAMLLPLIVIFFSSFAVAARIPHPPLPALGEKLAENFVTNVHNLFIEKTIGNIQFALIHEKPDLERDCPVCDYDIPDTFSDLCPLVGFSNNWDVLAVLFAYFRIPISMDRFVTGPAKARIRYALQAIKRCTKRIERKTITEETLWHPECMLATQVVSCAFVDSVWLIKPVLWILASSFIVSSITAALTVAHILYSSNN